MSKFNGEKLKSYWLLDRENIWMEDICKLNTLLGQICKFNRDVLQHSNNEASINCVEHINDCFHNIGEFGYELKNMAIKGSCDKEKINYGTENLETFFKIIYDENFTRFLPLDSKTLLFFIEKYDYYLWFREFKERIMMQYE